MKNYIIIALVALFSLNLSAQETSALDSVQRARYEKEKKSIVKEALNLSAEESTKFWPIYEEYNQKSFELDKIIVDAVKANYKKMDSLTDDESEDIWKLKMENDYKIYKLEKKYFKKVLKVLSGSKTLRYFQLENKISAINRAQLAVDIPLFNEKSSN